MRAWFHGFDDALWIQRSERGDEAAFLARVLRLRRGRSVLDAPCGEGGVSVRLARRGVRVTGVDLRDAAVGRARATFSREGLDGRFLVADLRDLAFDGEFDAAFNWYGSFGYFADEAGDLRALRGLARAVRRGGLVLVDQPNRERILRQLRGRFEQGGVSVRNRWDARTQRIEATWRLATRPGRSWRSSIRLYTPAQYGALFDAAGLDVVAAHGHWDGEGASRGARRTIVVGRRR